MSDRRIMPAEKAAEELAFLRSVLEAYIRRHGPISLSRADLQSALDSPGQLMVDWGVDDFRIVEVEAGREGTVH